ncbi:cysteine proteinase [Trichocladium antarcticum]|uniref:Ubiquitin carboxyl-terminal hydrolase n=1 Tax=Trichocladium antarcticum TaxID=1450529 RepID=A0AAN6ZFR5_9PEZI|nr:cysteine proteinase [Trichocladium antarcticum]
MGGFFHKLKAAGTGSSKSDNGASTKNKKEEPPLDLTPVERLLHNAGPVREDGSDKFFGLENFGNTCYCNSIVQALYHSDHFREHVVNYPLPSPWDEPNRAGTKVHVTIRPPPTQANGNVGLPAKPRPSFAGGQLVPGMASLRPEDRPEAPEYKKKQAMIKGPVLELAQTDADPYGMRECTFTGLKDIFTALIDSQSRTGVLSPQRFLDIFKRDNEMFRNSMHQDAHEFYGIVLNDVIANVETNARRMHKLAESRTTNGVDQPLEAISPMGGPAVGNRIPGTGWVHDIFEGVLTSETRCLACERASQRDETFLDLSIDLEEHSSVTSCLQKFSAEEMLCERNKFHCDHCGGLQEAEKRMKIKKLPKVLALHLKRFKYTEDYSRLQKLFHRVVYPYHLRMFNTTDDVEDPDRLYELYAVVVHIGGNAYHGHYVAVIKTKDRGWLLFDDEMVEPVDKHFVRNFFGDKPGMACAYVLFYQEKTFEQVRKEMDAEGLDEVKLAAETAVLATTIQVNGASPATLPTLNTQPLPPVNENDTHVALNHSKSNPGAIISPMDQLPPPLALSQVQSLATPLPPAVMTSSDPATTVPQKSKEEMAREKKELKAQEKARKTAEKEQLRLAAKERHETQNRLRETARLEREQHHKAMHDSKQLAAEEEKRHKKETAEAAGLDNGFLNRAGRTSKSMTRKSFAFLNGKADKDRAAGDHSDKTDRSEASDTRSDQAMPPLKERFGFGLGKRKSSRFFSGS